MVLSEQIRSFKYCWIKGMQLRVMADRQVDTSASSYLGARRHERLPHSRYLGYYLYHIKAIKM